MVIYIIKQDDRIYVHFSRPNGWTEWAEIFCVHTCVASGVSKAKKCFFFFADNFTSFWITF